MGKQGEGKKKRQPARAITSLSQLDTLHVTLELTRPDGEEIALSGTPLSYTRWVEIGYEIADPTPPIMGADSAGKPLYDRNDPEYRRQLTSAGIRRSYARLVEFLDIDVPGKTLDEQIAALETVLSAGEVQALVGKISDLFAGEEARIAERAATFHGAGSSAQADDAAAGDAQP